MSVSASIDVHLSQRGSLLRSPTEIIQVLINAGWSLNHSNCITYLPLGDKDDFDWQSEKNMSFSSLTKIIKDKQKAKETVGTIMTWRDTLIGGSFLFWPDDTYETFSMNLDGNRQTTAIAENYTITDFSWYLEKLLPCLNKIWIVEYFSVDQHI